MFLQETEEANTQTHRQRLCEDGGGDVSEAATSQECLGLSDVERSKEGLSPKLPEERGAVEFQTCGLQNCENTFQLF